MIETILPQKALSVLLCLRAFNRGLHIREVARFCGLSPRGASLILSRLQLLDFLDVTEIFGKGSRRRKIYSLRAEIVRSEVLSDVAKAHRARALEKRSSNYSVNENLTWIDETLAALRIIKSDALK